MTTKTDWNPNSKPVVFTTEQPLLVQTICEGYKVVTARPGDFGFDIMSVDGITLHYFNPQIYVTDGTVTDTDRAIAKHIGCEILNLQGLKKKFNYIEKPLDTERYGLWSRPSRMA